MEAAMMFDDQPAEHRDGLARCCAALHDNPAYAGRLADGGREFVLAYYYSGPRIWSPRWRPTEVSDYE